MTRIYAGIGSRETPPLYLGYAQGIAMRLRVDFGYWLSSGGAKGADQAFEAGAADKKYIYRAKPEPSPEAFELAKRFHPAWDACSPYAKALHARNGMIVLGPWLNKPVEFIICWTKGGLTVGGTGQALRIADAYDIPVYNLAIEGTMEAIEKMLESKNAHQGQAR